MYKWKDKMVKGNEKNLKQKFFIPEKKITIEADSLEEVEKKENKVKNK